MRSQRVRSDRDDKTRGNGLPTLELVSSIRAEWMRCDIEKEIPSNRPCACASFLTFDLYRYALGDVVFCELKGGKGDWRATIRL